LLARWLGSRCALISICPFRTVSTPDFGLSYPDLAAWVSPPVSRFNLRDSGQGYYRLRALLSQALWFVTEGSEGSSRSAGWLCLLMRWTTCCSSRRALSTFQLLLLNGHYQLSTNLLSVETLVLWAPVASIFIFIRVEPGIPAGPYQIHFSSRPCRLFRLNVTSTVTFC
jgi:hypothetical protein